MNTNIRSKRADEVWLAALIEILSSNPEYSIEDCVYLSDDVMRYWAARFADDETLQDIEANKARR